MDTFVSLLRGINIGGHRKILMADLKKLYESLGFQNITTYIQSGNVVFQTKSDNPGDLEKLITDAIHDAYGYDVPTVVRTRSHIQEMFTQNPFSEGNLYVAFLQRDPTGQGVQNLGTLDFGTDRYEIIGREVYLCYQDGYRNTKLNNNTLEKHLGTYATTRNWRTCTKILELMTQ